ncbi:sugar kinase [Paenibacillus psychroresistens]|uniref:Sugar kinase n=1 Tax=Paenibacillus psychroresistens TaxID=1778678 RepID=A0A6B8RVP6_9BACL|nr:PfkB family carbohydrate kinase [Paenibacillus psychroresistens]QGQ99513.1 sugar kinase [Paenibacillus psychroresistens]
MDNEKIPSSISDLERFDELSHERMEQIFADISQLKAGVIGDGCLDIYWHADMTLSQLSRETPHYPLPIVREVYSPGAVGNVAANLKALGCKEVYLCSVLGKDWRGDLLRQSLSDLGILDSFSLMEENWITPAYCKPIRHGLQDAYQEDPRLDFQNYIPMSEQITERLIAKLDQMAAVVDVIAVTDQFQVGVVGAAVRKRLAYWSKLGKIIVVDSRDRIGLYTDVIVKPNEVEGLRWVNPNEDPRLGTWELWLDAAQKLSQQVNAPCCMTLGEKGSLWIEQGQSIWATTKPAEPPLDIVGAGDCFASALLAGLGTGCSGPEAMAFAHLAASVVIRKLGTTGTASPEEIRITKR